ncbi:hypothetical protein PGT21_050194 [Puccinia graminis f. sp. tritici]|uniref:Uncharacterized protein n=1 Tax=Puccinia graminis f. sp. tritici TaxID=56615 RepID=A0A5B0PK25_PUCGR|nr:hypothetical protein PGT21_050194 [Puccinia graminis f. sp. tritici]
MFSSQDYFNTYRYIHGSHGSVSYEKESAQLGNQVLNDRKGFIDTTKKLIHQIFSHSGISFEFKYHLTERQSAVCVLVFYLLGFIERELCPGIIKELIDEISFPHQPLWKAQDHITEIIQLVFLTSRYNILEKIAVEYWDITKNGNLIQDSPYKESIYKGYLKELAEVLADFKLVNLRFSPTDTKLIKFDKKFLSNIQRINQDGDAHLNDLMGRA